MPLLESLSSRIIKYESQTLQTFSWEQSLNEGALEATKRQAINAFIGSIQKPTRTYILKELLKDSEFVRKEK